MARSTSPPAATRHYTVSDGRIVLFLWPQPEGGYTITSPMDDRLVSQADSLEDAFAMGQDALDLLRSADRAPSRRVAASAAKRAGAASRRRRSTRAS